MIEKKVAAVGFCCTDIYENLNERYATGNGIDWGIHLQRMGVPVSVISVVGNDIYGDEMKQTLKAEGTGGNLYCPDGASEWHRSGTSGFGGWCYGRLSDNG